MKIQKCDIQKLLGKTLKKIDGLEKFSKEAYFYTENEKYKMYHEQDCVENVLIEDVCGEVSDLIGVPILLAEEVTSQENPADAEKQIIEDQDDSFTWTFYRLSTMKGDVTIRWYGESNGCGYSESVDFVQILD